MMAAGHAAPGSTCKPMRWQIVSLKSTRTSNKERLQSRGRCTLTQPGESSIQANGHQHYSEPRGAMLPLLERVRNTSLQDTYGSPSVTAPKAVAASHARKASTAMQRSLLPHSIQSASHCQTQTEPRVEPVSVARARNSIACLVLQYPCT